jgi:hypothetical protein
MLIDFTKDKAKAMADLRATLNSGLRWAVITLSNKNVITKYIHSLEDTTIKYMVNAVSTIELFNDENEANNFQTEPKKAEENNDLNKYEKLGWCENMLYQLNGNSGETEKLRESLCCCLAYLDHQGIRRDFGKNFEDGLYSIRGKILNVSELLENISGIVEEAKTVVKDEIENLRTALKKAGDPRVR